MYTGKNSVPVAVWETARFEKGSVIDRTLVEGDKLFVCGDFGFIFSENDREQKALQFLSEKPYQILWGDGNHENFTALHEYPVELSLNSFLEFIRENIKYRHWYMGHLHRDEDVWRHQSILWFELRNMITNEIIAGE